MSFEPPLPSPTSSSTSSPSSSALALGGALVLAVALAVALAACGGSSSTPPDAAHASCADYARTRCERLEECAPAVVAATSGTRADCERIETAACARRQGADGSGLTEAVLAGCRDELATAACVAVFDYELSSCRARGTLADGTACFYDDQCAGGACFRDGGATCGVCRSTGARGEPCSPDPDAGATCGPGLACHGIMGTCQPTPISLEGETCLPSTFRRCATSLFCDSSYTCVPQRPEGASCTELLNECDHTKVLFCDPFAGDRCAPVPRAGVGEACSPIGVEGGALCQRGAVCVLDGAELRCVATRTLGESCDDATARCGDALGLRCVGGTCVDSADLICAGGDIDPGDPGPEPEFVFDILGNETLTLQLDCAASTAVLRYVARYGNRHATPQEATTGTVEVRLGALVLPFTVAPTTSGVMQPYTSIAIEHGGTGSLPPGACQRCEQAAELSVLVRLGAQAYSHTVPVPMVACSL